MSLRKQKKSYIGKAVDSVFDYFKKRKDKVKKPKKVPSPPKTNAIKGAKLVKRKAPTKADDMARANQYKSVAKTNTKKLKKNVKEVNKTSDKLKNIAKITTLVGSGAYLANRLSKAGGDKNKNTSKPKDNSPSTKKNFGMGMVDSLPKSKVKQGPPKPVAKAPKRKSRSNISNSSSYDANFTAKKLKERGLSPKASMSAKNYAKTTEAKEKKIAKGMDFGQKKKKVKAPMYEYSGTNGKVKTPTPKIPAKKYTGKKKSYTVNKSGNVQFKMGGGKMAMSKYYSGGGTVFTGR